MHKTPLPKLIALQKTKQKVWEESVLPYLLSHRASFWQKGLLWFAENALVGVFMGMTSLGVVGVFAWEANKYNPDTSNVVEVVFSGKKPVQSFDPSQNKYKSPYLETVYTKGTFQPIVVEDQFEQPLENIVSGTTGTYPSQQE